MTVETDKQYQETVEADANMLCQLKQRDNWPDIAIIFFISIKFMEVWMYQIRRKLRMCIATLCYNLWVLILIVLMESEKQGQ